MDSDTLRAVWLEEIELGLSDRSLAELVRMRFEDATANPAEAIAKTLDPVLRPRYLSDPYVNAVLAALRHPTQGKP